MKRGLGSKLAISYVVIVAVVFLVTALVIDRAARSGFMDELTASTVAQSRAVAVALHDGPVEPMVHELAAALGVRITVIDVTGVVTADSMADPATMADHNDRPEVVAARLAGSGTTIRFSETIGEELLYVAVQDGGRIVRLAVPVADVNQRMLPVRLRALIGIFVVTLVGLIVIAVNSRRIGRLMGALTASVSRVAAGQPPNEDLGAGTIGNSPDVVKLSDAVRSMADQISSRMGELENEQDLRDRVLGALDEGVLLLRAGMVDYANPAAVRMLGSSLSGDARLRHHQILQLVADQPGSTRIALGTRSVEVIVGPAADQSVVVLRDVTDLVRTEAIRRDFVADASHELKTPVAAIRAAAETIQAAADDKDMTAVKHFSHQVEKSAERLAQIVTDLLDLSRLESSGFETTPVDLGILVADETAAAETGHLDVTTIIESVTIQASPPDVALAVRNLLTNAARHTDAGGSMRVVVSAEGNEAIVSVSDTGSGIPVRDVPRIFERFYRVDAARSRQTGGTGLGLAIVRHVVERHGGSVEVESEFGVGSTFRMRFPMPTASGDRAVAQPPVGDEGIVGP